MSNTILAHNEKQHLGLQHGCVESHTCSSSCAAWSAATQLALYVTNHREIGVMASVGLMLMRAERLLPCKAACVKPGMQHVRLPAHLWVAAACL